MASLFVIQGADQGKRYEFQASPVALGRDNSNAIRLHDTEVSRRHAEIRLDDELYRVFDLGSANGTFVNGHLVDQAPLRTGDRLQLGQTVMLYNEGPLGARRDLTARVDLLSKSSPEDRSAILRSIPSDEGSRVLQQPDGAAGWLRERLMSLSVMYRATQAVSHILDVDSLLPQVLELVFESIGADRGAILLRDEAGVLTPKAVRWRTSVEADERMAISSTITDYVLEQGQGVITTDAPGDTRFGPAESILDLRIREAICVPVQGRHTTLGVLYADIQADGSALIPVGKPGRGGKFSQDHLMLMVAIGHQAGLAIENTTFYNDKIQAERLAAVGQTIATLSHHIKNILQGVRGGSYLIDLGLNEKDESIVRRGWTIVEKNQTKIYNLVMDMLSFSKDREPALEPTDLNETVGDVVELMQSRAEEFDVRLEWDPRPDLPKIWVDPDGIHRAVLNVLTNAIDAAEGAVDACVAIKIEHDADAGLIRIRIKDNGRGIEEGDIPGMFQIFSSSKGSRGTGLGLPVSQKIVREHGGSIQVASELGRGSTFSIELPAVRRPEPRDHADDPVPPDDLPDE
ncbi:ATP-binding protein [Planctomyces sp. SH-PL62]|uniref:ATP-binding protein n=1 Tax=Planctomyces sp. SH-PL62 TaxID=1636152 RepID=UPI00078D0377|nr:ATP-binding protein [Planctomyces sp. SH-PL62]AMV36118.1 Sensor protein ZraS [Planctomyces sp. SH-PL62]